MVVVRCLILCSKFAKNRLSAGLCLDPLGSLHRSHRSHGWIMGKGGERGDGRAGGGEGVGKKGEGRRGGEGSGSEGRGKGGISPRMKICRPWQYLSYRYIIQGFVDAGRRSSATATRSPERRSATRQSRPTSATLAGPTARSRSCSTIGSHLSSSRSNVGNFVSTKARIVPFV